MTRPVGNVYAFPTAGPLPRRPLWELPPGLHCPAIGIGLPIDELRAALDALFAGSSTACDYELHAAVVRECSARNAVSELVQDELDRRHAGAIERCRDAASCDALARHWNALSAEGDVAGAMWAVIGHPHCDTHLAEHVARETHMLQHRALAAMRDAADRAAALAIENQLLRTRLAEAQRDAERAVQRRRPRWGFERLWRPARAVFTP